MENQSKIICKNCDTSFEGLYCPMCRQTARTGCHKVPPALTALGFARLPDGTYFYVLKYLDEPSQVMHTKSGYLYITE